MTKLVITQEEWIGSKTAKSFTEQRILDLFKPAVEYRVSQLIETGLPEDWHERLKHFGEVLCERADVMLYPDKKTIAEAQQIFEEFINAVATLAFVRGGVHIFGHHFEVVHDGSGKA